MTHLVRYVSRKAHQISNFVESTPVSTAARAAEAAVFARRSKGWRRVASSSPCFEVQFETTKSRDRGAAYRRLPLECKTRRRKDAISFLGRWTKIARQTGFSLSSSRRRPWGNSWRFMSTFTQGTISKYADPASATTVSPESDGVSAHQAHLNWGINLFKPRFSRP